MSSFIEAIRTPTEVTLAHIHHGCEVLVERAQYEGGKVICTRVHYLGQDAPAWMYQPGLHKGRFNATLAEKYAKKQYGKDRTLLEKLEQGWTDRLELLPFIGSKRAAIKEYNEHERESILIFNKVTIWYVKVFLQDKTPLVKPEKAPELFRKYALLLNFWELHTGENLEIDLE